jgi:hypothetical protein
MTALDVSLALAPVGEGVWRARADPAREANTGMFGGWTAALLAKAVLADPRASGSLSAITVNYINRVPPGSALTLSNALLGGSKSLTHWRCELFVDGAEGVAAVAHVVLANRRDSDRFTEETMPDAPAPDALPVFHPPGAFGATVNMHFVFGGDPHHQPTTRSIAWQRETTGMVLNEIALVYLSDVGWPRAFALSPAPRPSATIAMSVYIHATQAEIAACGEDYILCDMVGTRIEQATVGSRANLWSRKGALLASTEQLCWFR